MSEPGKWERWLGEYGDQIFVCGLCISTLRCMDAISTPWREVLGLSALFYVLSLALHMAGILIDHRAAGRAEARYRVRRAMRGEG